jgi:hypothetical protein
MTTHPLIGGAKDTILGTYQQVSAAAAKGFFAATRGSGALALEGSMITLKGLMIVGALLVGTTSLAMAQAEGSSGPDGQLVSAGAADNPPALGSTPSTSTRAARHHGTRHHRMYMMSVNRTHKGSKLTPANNAKPLSEWLHRP